MYRFTDRYIALRAYSNSPPHPNSTRYPNQPVQKPYLPLSRREPANRNTYQPFPVARQDDKRKFQGKLQSVRQRIQNLNSLAERLTHKITDNYSLTLHRSLEKKTQNKYLVSKQPSNNNLSKSYQPFDLQKKPKKETVQTIPKERVREERKEKEKEEEKQNELKPSEAGFNTFSQNIYKSRERWSKRENAGQKAQS